MKQIFTYTDGASRGNPGHSSGGVLITDVKGNILFQGGAYFGIGTNNEAEYRALQFGIEKASYFGAEEIHCHMDSELVVKQLSGAYRLKSPRMLELNNEVRQMLTKFKKSTFKHLPREHAQMRIADRLANRALDEAPQTRLGPSGV